jgi:hypothetical protein
MTMQRGCIVKYARGGLFIATRATTAIVLHHFIPILHLANVAVSLGCNHLRDS